MRVPLAVVSVVAAACGAFAGQFIGEDGVLVYVNGEPIPKSTLTRFVGPFQKAGVSDEEMKVYRDRYMRQIVKDVLIRQFIGAEGYEPTEREIEAEIARLRRIYEENRQDGSPAFEQALRNRGTSVEEMRRGPTAGMRFSCYVRSTMTEEDLQRFLETQRHCFDGTEVRASRVLIDPSRARSAKPAHARWLARRGAEEIRRRAAGGEDFAALARDYSHCPSRTKGGDLGFFTRYGRMSEELARAAFALGKGEVSPVLETSSGFHIVKVTDIRPGRRVALDDVREEVVERWAKERGREVYDEVARRAKVEWPEK